MRTEAFSASSATATAERPAHAAGSAGPPSIGYHQGVPARRLAVGAALLTLAGLCSAGAQGLDERLVLQVEQLIAGQRGLRIYDWVGFSVDSGAVTLEGAVTRPSIREAIESSVRALEAVASVHNRIELLPRIGDDIGIRVNAYWRIYGHPEIRRYLGRDSDFSPRLRRAPGDVQRVLLQPIHIIVRNGDLVLEGELEQQREKRVAGQQARAVLGVRSVTNNIVVTGADTEEFEPIDFEQDPWWIDSESVAEPVLRVENPAGGVRVQIVNTERVRLRRSSRSRPIRDGDTKTTRLGRKTRIRAMPPDGALIDLDIDLPYGHRLEVQTVDGPITLRGLVRRAQLETAIGRVELEVPWRSVGLEVVSDRPPATLEVPPDLRAVLRLPPPGENTGVWTLGDSRDRRGSLYGAIRLDARAPDALVLREAEIGNDSPVRMHWQAPQALDSMLRRPFRLRMTAPGGTGSEPGPSAESADGAPVQFSSDVRLVQLAAAVVDADNRPVQGLGADDFRILEDGAEQRIRLVQDTEAEFNLVLLLDCSTSTLVDREAVLEAARQFVQAARPADRVGIYVLSDAYVHVVSPLTADREALLRTINQIPRLSGGTPLYDAITLSYAHELARRRWERNAIIVISDGMDNDLLPQWSRSVPSEVQFEDLLRAAAEINSAIYPIFLEPEMPGVRTDRAWRERLRRSTDHARERMRQLAEATGGRLFRTESIRDLDAVYGLVAEELRSVYTLGYYPANQEFDGKWRRIRVSVGGPGLRVRTRPGYYGW